MLRYLRKVQGLAGVGLLLGLGLVGGARAVAQPSAAPAPPTQIPDLSKVQVGPIEKIQTPAKGAPLPANPGANDPPIEGGLIGEPAPPKKTFWETHPAVRPLPRPGEFIIFPTGPGYYSLSDLIHDNERQKPPVFPYSPISPMFNAMYDANFLYLDDPNNQQHDWADCFHRIHLGDCWMFSTGGEERLRYMDEENSRLTGKDNHYLLERTRVYGDLWYGDQFRVYVEFIDARSTHQNLNPLLIDQNHGDLLDAFVDVKLVDLCDHPVYARIGRQELLFGSERLVSPLDWANTRRTFQGVDVFRQGEKFDIDAFWVQPVVPNPDDFDSVDDRQNFTGVYATYRPKKGTYLDLYVLDENNANPTFAGSSSTILGGYELVNIGSRFAGDYQNVLWDFEGDYQFGDWSNQNISAGSYTTSLGYNFSKVLPWNPTYWVEWDWASGNHNPTGSTHGTFNQLFPFGHYYFGFIDDVGRQNIEDFNMQLSLSPMKWILVNMQYHHFWLESASDALYSAGGAVLRSSPTGTAGRDVGNEFDIFVNFHLDAHQDILVGYSHMQAGDFLRNTGNGAAPELAYFQYSFRW
jgi:hypothetical protein